MTGAYIAADALNPFFKGGDNKIDFEKLWGLLYAKCFNKENLQVMVDVLD